MFVYEIAPLMSGQKAYELLLSHPYLCKSSSTPTHPFFVLNQIDTETHKILWPMITQMKWIFSG